MLLKRLSYIFIIVFSIIFFVLNWAVPFFSDDVWLINTLDKDGLCPFVSSLIDSQINIWLNENGRAMNHLVWQVLVNCGELYYDFFITIVFVGVVYLMRPLYWNGQYSINMLSLSIIVLCILYLSPASESNFYWAAGGCHYLWPCFLSLIFLHILKGMQSSSKRCLIQVVAFSFVSFISGWTHEIFALPISFALLVVIIIRYVRFNVAPSLQMWIVIVSYWLGALLIVVSPGTWHRILMSFGGETATSIGQMLANKLVVSFKIFRYGRLFYVVCALGAFMIIKNRKRVDQFVSENLFVVLCLLSSIAMIVILGVGGRAIWSIEFFSLIILLICIDKIVKEKCVCLIVNRCGVVLSILMMIHMTCLINPYFDSWNTYKEVASQSSQNGNGTARMNRWESDFWFVDNFVAHPYDMIRDDVWMRLPLRCEVCRSDVFDFIMSTNLTEDSIVNIAGDYIIKKTKSVDEYIDNGQMVMSFSPIDWNMSGGVLFVVWHKFVSGIWPRRYPHEFVVNRNNVTLLNIGGVEYYRFESPYAPIPRDISSVEFK